MRDKDDSLAVAGTCFILIAAIVAGVALGHVVEHRARPEVLILREYVADTVQGPAICVDYLIGGMASNAYFYDDEMPRYYAFLEMLEREGRIVRVKE